MTIENTMPQHPSTTICPPRLRWLAGGLLVLGLALLAGCSITPMRGAPAWAQSRQLVLVTTAGWDANQATLRTFERSAAGWRPVMAATPATVGRAGTAWGTGLHATQSGPVKREGDGRAPAGVFRIGTAFGYGTSLMTALPYRAMQASDYCIDVNTSPLYNRIVDANEVGQAAVAGSTEPMRRDIHADGDQRYQLGFVIEHNAANVPAAGSCIFAHVWKMPGEPTAGCTAMDAAVMAQLLGWLRPERKPVFVLLPQAQYARLRAPWGLPVIAPTTSPRHAANSQPD